MDACTRSLALGAGAFVTALVGAASATPAGLALAAAGVSLYAAARRALSMC